jgi:hypothetical protein
MVVGSGGDLLLLGLRFEDSSTIEVKADIRLSSAPRRL